MLRKFIEGELGRELNEEDVTADDEAEDNDDGDDDDDDDKQKLFFTCPLITDIKDSNGMKHKLSKCVALIFLTYMSG